MSLSPYWSEAFISSEKNTFSTLGFNYLEPEEKSNSSIDILITNTHSNLDSLTPEQRKNLKLIIHPNSGYDNFSFDFVSSVACPIILGNSLRAKAVSEVILAELFSRCSLSPSHKEWDKNRSWPRSLLSEKKVLIVGMGMIGNTIFQTLQHLTEELFLYDPFKGYSPLPKNIFDVVILCQSLNPLSQHFVNEEFLKQVASDGMIINCARGELVNTKDLLTFLRSNPESYAYLDVFEKEPCSFADLQLQNLKLSSHIAGVHSTLEEKTKKFIYDVLNNFKTLSSNDFLQTYDAINLKNRMAENFLI